MPELTIAEQAHLAVVLMAFLRDDANYVAIEESPNGTGSSLLRLDGDIPLTNAETEALRKITEERP